MLDPRSLSSQRAEIEESCRRRAAAVDLDGAIAAQERVAALQTSLGELGRRRNEHQASGKGKLSAEEREAHGAQGRHLPVELVRRFKHEVLSGRRVDQNCLGFGECEHVAQ